MELLLSSKFKLPTVYFITDRSKIKEIPIGVPFIYGKEESKDYIVRLLEYEIIYQKALKTGYPFNFKQLLQDAGFEDLKRFGYQHPIYMDIISDGDYDVDYPDIEVSDIDTQLDGGKLSEFIKDSSVYVNIDVLKKLNVFPIWMDSIEEAVKTNIHNYAVFNPNMYNKKLDGVYGGIEIKSPNRNLIIIDISGSIPKGVSSTCLILSKNLAESFYADILITGSKSTIYSYEDLGSLNIEAIYNENGMENDQAYFKKLVSGDERHYGTVIVFGDNHHPGMRWNNKYNRKSVNISDEDGKKLCKWKIDKLISFHTSSAKQIAGYARWFKDYEVEHIDNWVKYMN